MVANAAAAQQENSWSWRLRRFLPEGRELPEAEWRVRHRAILAVVAAHVAGTAAFGFYMGVPVAQAVFEPTLIGLLGLAAAWDAISRRARGALAALALVTSSAVIVQFSGGYIEAHFHFFVILAVIAAYQDWIPFLLAILYVAVDHGVVGTLWPTMVYNHHDALHHPWKWAMIHAAMVLGESAALLGGWKVAETAKRRTDLVLQSAAEGILGLDLDDRIAFANGTAAAMAGRDVSKLLGMRVGDALPGVSSSTAKGEAALHGRSVEWSGRPIMSHGAVTGQVVTLRDVTERKRSEGALKLAVSTLTATLESTTDGILVIDSGGRIAGYNQKFVRMWRIPSEVMDMRDDAKAIAFVTDQLKDPEGFVAKIRDLYARPEDSSFDTIDFADGRVFERYSQPQRQGERTIGRVWSFRDVTERKRAEENALLGVERLAEIRRLQEMDRMKTQFINTLSHELRTPLTPIKVQLHLMRKANETGDDALRARSSDVIERNFNRMSKLVDELLEVARLQAGTLKLDPERMDLSHALAEAVDSFKEVARQQDVTLDADVESSLPVEADARRLTQVVYNLLSNALKFTPKGGRIRLSARSETGRVVVSVADSGAGLGPEDLKRLFEPFSQIHDPMEKTNAGTGLGLYISRGIVEGHGGRIWCESPGVGQGSTFAFEIPRATA